MFSYDPNVGTALDHVRLLVQDVTESTAKLQDEEIAALLTAAGDAVYPAAATAADVIAARYAEMVTRAIEPSARIELSDRFKHYTQLADRLRSVAATSGLVGTGLTTALVPIRTGGGDPYAPRTWPCEPILDPARVLHPDRYP